MIILDRSNREDAIGNDSYVISVFLVEVCEEFANIRRELYQVSNKKLFGIDEFKQFESCLSRLADFATPIVDSHWAGRLYVNAMAGDDYRDDLNKEGELFEDFREKIRDNMDLYFSKPAESGWEDFQDTDISAVRGNIRDVEEHVLKVRRDVKACLDRTGKDNERH